MRKKFVGPPNPGPDGAELGHDVMVNGTEFKVKPGDVIDVPDEAVAERRDPKTKAVTWPGVEFPAELWEDAPAESKKKGEG